MSDPALSSLLDWMLAGSFENKAAAATVVDEFDERLLDDFLLLLPQPAVKRPAAASAAIRRLVVIRICCPLRMYRSAAGRPTQLRVTGCTALQALSKSPASREAHAAPAHHDAPGGNHAEEHEAD